MPSVAFTPAEINAIIDYAQRKFAEERYPLSPALRPVREALAKLDPRPQAKPVPAKPYVPSTVMEKKRRR